VLCLGVGMTLMAQDTVTVNVTIRGHLAFVLDGTDAGGNLTAGDYTTAETCDFGTSDAGGGAITGGDALVTGLTGIPVDAAGLDLGAGGLFDPTCVGSFYSFFNTVGVPDRFNHDDAALGIYIQSSALSTYSLDVSAAVAGAASVTVGQLKWKDNATTGGSGYTDYTDFSAGSTNITSGGAGALQLNLFHDYGLLVEFADATGNYTWTVTYTLTTT
jgi:hypothetical protein